MKCPKCLFDNASDSKFCKECGTRILASSAEFPGGPAETPITPIKELTRGTLFANRYQVIGVLGHGGMGKVYKVLDKKLDVEIALKLVKPEIASDERIIEGIKNELMLTRVISNQTFCRTYDLSEDMGRSFITMEYVPGENLKNTIQSAGSLNLSRTLAIAKQICEGLAAAHRLGIIHGDLKPQNIMLNQFGIVRIMNLEISRSFLSRGITADGIMIGTPGYVSPEQAKGSKVDARSDIYSFGAILFEMVTGKVPVESETTLSFILERKLGPPPDPGALVSHPSKGISRIILKCLEKDRDRRYVNVEALYADLEREEREIRATDEIPIPEIEEPGQAKPGVRPYAIAGISLAVIAALIGGYLYLGRANKEPGGDAKRSMPAVQETAQPKSSPPIPSADASPQTGSVKIDPIPPDATIVLNGKPEGMAPLKKKMPPVKFGLKINTIPPGASVTIGNEAAAISPVTRNMDPGRYAVKIEKEGFRSVQESLTVEADVDKTYELTKLLPGKVRFNVYPYANVFIDDKLVGEVPPVETMELAEGKYTLKFVSAGLDKTLTVELEIRSEENKEVRVNMVTGETKMIKL